MAKMKSGTWFLDWYKYCQAYLHLAQVGILELKYEVYRNRFTLFQQEDIYVDKTLLIPVIWCLKHAIELLLKALTTRITQEFSTTHNNSELYKEVKQAFSILKIRDSKLLEELIVLSDEYYKLNFWSAFPKQNSDVSDNLNDVFRYPESRVDFSLDVSKLHEVTGKNILELEDDIKEFYRLLLKLHGEITRAKVKSAKR